MHDGSALIRDHVSIGGHRIELDGLINPEFLKDSRIAELQKQLFGASPFPHVVVDGLFSPELLHAMNREFESMKWKHWKVTEHEQEDRRGTLPNVDFGPASRLYFQTVYSTAFTHFMAKLTRMPDLVTDPSLLNGGFHEMPQGGRFDVHIDYTHHPVTRLQNRMVMITYLNPDWKLEYGGQLQLVNGETKQVEVEVVPEFGRTVLFLNGPGAYHGCPVPIEAPEGRTRRSAAAYFYGPFKEEVSAAYTEYLDGPTAKKTLMRTIRYFLPPVLVDGVRRVAQLAGKGRKAKR